MTQDGVNHRQRLRNCFTEQKPEALSDERILELLLTYGIPQKDVFPLANELIAAFGSLVGVLSADRAALVQHQGLKDYSAILIKLVDWIRKTYPANDLRNSEGPAGTYTLDPEGAGTLDIAVERKPVIPDKRRAKTGLFSKAMLGESIKVLPTLPDTDSIQEIREFLKNNLAFNSEQTRARNASYIIQRMFPNGKADKVLRKYARYYAGKQELKDVCYYRFCMKETLMLKITDDLFIPGITGGTLQRNTIKAYLHDKWPQAKNIKDCVQAIAEALNAGGIAKCTRDTVSYTYRDINLASFTFILHSEFPEPGIYDIKLLEQGNAVRLMLWRPDQLLSALFELRNQGILSKVSEIDNVRQFTTQYTLAKAIAVLTAGEVEI